jgi:predicted Zn-dependent protease
VTIAHELGHTFGLWHVHPSTRRSVMNPGNTTITPTERDVDSVRALWGNSCDRPQEH